MIRNVRIHTRIHRVHVYILIYFIVLTQLLNGINVIYLPLFCTFVLSMAIILMYQWQWSHTKDIDEIHLLQIAPSLVGSADSFWDMLQI